MTNDWNWPGSRWWRCDFHVHSPGSYDFKNRESVTARQWVEAALAAKLDAVAVTDHNTGTFVEKALAAAAGTALRVIPGVELSVSPGVHLLALFDPAKPPSCATNLVAAVDIPDEKVGQQDALSPKSIPDVLRLATERGAVCIAAHVDGPDGLAAVIPQGQSLLEIAQDPKLAAVEAKDLQAPVLAYFANNRSQNGRLVPPLPVVTFSDAHELGNIGRTAATWLKLTQPTAEGIRLAFSDGPSSVIPAALASGNPNRHASCVIESIEVSEGRYLGRGRPFVLPLNPWLNTIIGGRGTGKSSLLNFLRVALRREDELKDAKLREEFVDFLKVYQSRNGQGLLTEDTLVRVVYRKDGGRFRIQWNRSGAVSPIEEETPAGWVPSEGEIPSRFPVRIFSQKQAFGLSQEPKHLLKLVDEAAEVGWVQWNQLWTQEEARYLALRARARELEASLAEEPKLRGELADLTRKQKAFEQAGRAEVLQSYQRRARQRRALDAWVRSATEPAARLKALAEELTPPDLPTTLFDESDPADAAALDGGRKAVETLATIAGQARELAQHVEVTVRDFESVLASSAWGLAAQKAEADFNRLVEELRKAGIEDPAEYGRVVQARQAAEERLAALESKRSNLRNLEAQADESRARLAKLRTELTENRRGFLVKTLSGNPHVKIEVLAMADRTSFEEQFRTLLGTNSFEKDIYSSEEKAGLIWTMFEGLGEGTDLPLDRLQAFREKVSAIGRGNAASADLRDARFAGFVQKLKPEVFDRVDVLYPEDALSVSYSPEGDGRRFTPIAQGSPGQKTAAILAFILSHGDEPLVLDQPEDDLDNHLIYGLIVRQLREAKQRRQMLVVTHNANIVVNGDAELVHAFVVRNGRTELSASGGLQEQHVRDEVCEVMEGGREAFEARYRRISGGGPSA